MNIVKSAFLAFIFRRPIGSNPVVFSTPTKAQTNVSDLTKGDYEFRITVSDENNNNASGLVFVTVTQSMYAIFFSLIFKNSAHEFMKMSFASCFIFSCRSEYTTKANAGGDQTVVLPASVIVLNGSQSSDDLGIVSWKWTREPNSLAIGRVLGSPDTTPTLMVCVWLMCNKYFM